MRKLWILIGIALLTGALLALFLARPLQPGWTTDSETARAAFEAGLAAEMKYYHEEAMNHFAEAIRLDPAFAAARVKLLEYTREPERRGELAAELRAIDTDPLTYQERFLVRHALARFDRDWDEAARLAEKQLTKYPDCVYGLEAAADAAWERQDIETAKDLYTRLLELDPHWVSAQNRLGYLALAEGRFADAEQLIRTYTYLAPDQANPHDSLGEILTIRGRYEDARIELEEAVRIRPDFCPAHQHLVDLAILEGRPQDAAPLLERARGACDEKWIEHMICHTALWQDYLAGDYDSPWRPGARECLQETEEVDFLVHRMAALSGRTDEARAIEERFEERLLTAEASTKMTLEAPRALLAHLEGVRLLSEGKSAEAARRLTSADQSLRYSDNGILKLFNRLNLALALQRSGDLGGEREMLEAVREVNPAFAAIYPSLAEL